MPSVALFHLSSCCRRSTVHHALADRYACPAAVWSVSRPAALTCLLSGLMLCAGPACAQALCAPPDCAASLPDISVSAETSSPSYTVSSMSTATGLDLSLRETPQSVSTVTRSLIEDRHLQTTEAVLLSAPGISAIRNDSNRISLSARGFAIDNIQFDGLSSPVLSLWNYGATNLSSAIYERVEVVRGATGLMSGAGNPSAAVNFIRKRPTEDVFAAATVSAGRWNRHLVNTDLSTPVTADGTVRARFVAEAARGGSVIHRLDARSRTLYGIVTMDATPLTRLSAGVEYQENGNHGFGSGFPLFYSDGERTDFARSTANNTGWARMDTANTTSFADIRHRLTGHWHLRAVYSHHDGRYDMQQLFRGGYPDRQTGLGMTAVFSKYHGQRRRDEVHLTASGPFSLMGRRHEVAFGWMHIVEENHIARHPLLGTPPLIGSFFDWRGDVAEPVWSPQREQADDSHVTQTGTYGVARFSLAKPLHLIAGGRIGSWQTDQLFFGTDQAYRYHNQFIPYAGLVLDLYDVWSLYASHTGIFTPQNARGADGSRLPPIRGISDEAGIKAALMDGELNASAAVFRTRQNNLAQVIPDAMVPGFTDMPAYRPVEGATVRGMELELAGRLNAAWQISASVTRFLARDADGMAVNTTQPSTLVKLFSRVRVSESITLGAGVDWQNRTYQTAAGPLGDVEVAQGAYATVGVMAQYRISRHLSALLNINNVFDKKYYSQIGNFSQGWWGEPRNVTVTLRASY